MSSSGAGIGETAYVLRAHEELRVEASPTVPITVSLKSGTCEVFGTELAKDMPYIFSDAKLAFYTFHSCELIVSGVPLLAYVSSDCTTHVHANIHAELDKMRRNAGRIEPTVTVPVPPRPHTLLAAATDSSSSSSDNATSENASNDDSEPRLVTIPSPESAGPRALIVGAPGSGASSLFRTLVTYATRSNWQPTAVDLDPSDNLFSVPGSLSALSAEMPLGLGHGATLAAPAASAAALSSPLVHFFGHQTVRANEPLWRKQVTRLAKSVDARAGEPYLHALTETQAHYATAGADAAATAEASAVASGASAAEAAAAAAAATLANAPLLAAAVAAVVPGTVPQTTPPELTAAQRRTRASGVLVHFPSTQAGGTVELLAHAVAAFRIDVVVVVDNERLEAQLRQNALFEAVSVATVPKSSGVVSVGSLDSADRAARAARRIKEYFYGAKGDFAPQQMSIKAGLMQIFSTTPPRVLDDTLMPEGLAGPGNASEQLVVPADITGAHTQAIFAISAATTTAEVAESHVFGFLCVKNVEDGIVSCLAPTDEARPGNMRFVVGSIAWMD